MTSTDLSFSSIALLTRSWSTAPSRLSVLQISLWHSGIVKGVTASLIKQVMPVIASTDVACLTVTVLSALIGRSSLAGSSSDSTRYARAPKVSSRLEEVRIAVISIELPAPRLCSRRFARITCSRSATTGLITGQGERVPQELFMFGMERDWLTSKPNCTGHAIHFTLVLLTFYGIIRTLRREYGWSLYIRKDLLNCPYIK